MELNFLFMNKEIGNKLKEIRKALKLTQADFAKKLNVSDRTLRDYEKNRFSISYDFLTKLVEEFNVNPEWLLKGEGQLFSEETKKVLKTKPESSIPDECQDTFHYIPLLRLKTAASNSLVVYKQDEKAEAVIAFARYWIKNKFYASAPNLRAMEVDGDSMEPTINHGDIILVDQSRKTPSSGIYVIRIDDTLVVKRIQRKPDHIIKVMSDNKIYEDYEIDLTKDSNEVIGKVIWYGRIIA